MTSTAKNETASESRSLSRVAGLDAARIFATLGIVWSHVADIQELPARLSALGRFGTSFYVISAIFLASRSTLLAPTLRRPGWVNRRAKRLLLPFAIWSTLYGAFYLLTMLPQGYSVSTITRWWGPLSGTALHLWFLPFAFCAGVFGNLVLPRLLRLKMSSLVLTGLIVTVGAYALAYFWVIPSLNRPLLASLRLHRLDRWVEEVPLAIGAVFGTAIYGKGLTRFGRLGRRRRRGLALLASALFLAVQAAYALSLDRLRLIFWVEMRIFANLAGAFWLVAFLAARQGRWLSHLAPYGRATYFAFLAHMLVIDMTKGLVAKLPGYGELWLALLTTLGVYAIAVSLGQAAPRLRWARWLVP